jgi:cytoskeleton protein RodZ
VRPVSAEETEIASSDPVRDGLIAAGQRLAAARREQQREIGKVATALHLRVEIVEALETGDKASLPSITFVRGYIKSYARLLGLDEQRVIGLLPEAIEFRAAPLKTVGMRRSKPPIRLPIGKWLVWMATIGMLVLAVMYGMPLVEKFTGGTGQADTGSDAGALPLPLDMQLAPDLEVGSEVESVEEPVQPVEDESLPVQVEESPGAANDAAAAAEPGADAVVSPVADAGPALVEMTFSQDSWVEMESHGRKLLEGNQLAGSVRSVSAEPPISILLGNAPGVTILYRGNPVDIAPYQRGKVARLVLED